MIKPAVQAAHGDMRTKNVQAAMSSAGVSIHQPQAARAKKRILEGLHAAYLDGFRALEDVEDRFKRGNPDAVTKTSFRQRPDGLRHWVGTFIMLPQVPVGYLLLNTSMPQSRTSASPLFG